MRTNKMNLSDRLLSRFLIVALLIVLPLVLKGQTNPYPDGTTILANTTVSQNWSVAAGTTVTTAGNFTCGADGSIAGDFTVNGIFTISGWTGDVVTSTGRLEIESDLDSNGKCLTVQQGGVVVVKGNFKDTGGGPSVIDGVLVVLGDVDLSGVTVGSTGRLVVGGNITVHNAGGAYDGKVYALDPNAELNAPGGLLTGGDIGDLDDILQNEEDNDILNEVLEDLELLGGNTFYSFASGDWTDSQRWTLDPSGMLFNNPDGLVPGSGDNIVVLSGTEITMPNDQTVSCATITVDGRLDIGESSQSTFSEIRGGGTILLGGNNFPIGDASHFVSKGKGEGTVIFYGNGNYFINSINEFYNLEVALDTTERVRIHNDMNVNGDLIIKSGEFQFNDNVKTNSRSLTVLGDLELNNDGKLIVGTGNAIHNLTVHGNLLNNGYIKLSNQTAPDYANVANNGAVILTMTGASDVLMQCNGTTDLYKLVIDKGIDKTFGVELTSSDETNFRLFGPNNSGNAEDKALYLKNGALKLNGKLHIPTLTEGGIDFVIPITSKMQLLSSNVYVYTTAESQSQIPGFETSAIGVNSGGSSSALTLYGELEVLDGIFDTRNSAGLIINTTSNPSIKIAGGNVEAYEIRISGSSAEGPYNYTQSGGTLSLNGGNAFTMSDEDALFSMSGGEIVLNAGKFTVGSSKGNYNVSGGTIIMQGSSSEINSTSPVWNVQIDSNVSLANALEVSNNLVINSTLAAGAHELSIGADFTNNGTYNTNSNVTTFIGAAASLINGDIAFDKFEIKKTDATQTVSLGSGVISIAEDVSITKGILDIGSSDRNVSGNIEIIDGEISGNNALVLNSGTQQTLQGSYGREQEFGNIIVGNNTDLQLLSDVNVTDFTFGNEKVNIDTYNLTVSGSIYNYSDSHYFFTAGNSGAGGLTIQLSIPSSANGSVAFFPIGINRYTPVNLNINGQTKYTEGTLTIIPVDGEHPATIEDRKDDVLPYYWRTKVTGFDDLDVGVVELEFDYKIDVNSNYKVARLEDVDWTMGGQKIGNDQTILKFNNTAKQGSLSNLVEGDYTAGDDDGKGSPFGSIDVFYSRQSGNWFNTAGSGKDWYYSTWQDENGDVSQETPGKGDIVYIREGHRVNILSNQADIEIGMLVFEHDTAISNMLEDLPRLQVQTNNTLSLNRVKGTGVFTQWLDNSNDPIISGNFSEFSNEKYSWFLFIAKNDVDIPETFSIYPNVMTEGSGQSLTFTQDVLIQGHLNPRGDSKLLLNEGDNGDIYVFGDLIIGDWEDGELIFPGNGTPRTLTIEGDIDFTQAVTAPNNTRKLLISDGTNSLEHKLELYGNILQGVGEIDIANTVENGVIVSMLGDKSVVVSETGTANTNFYAFEINKPFDKKVHFTSDFTLGADASAAVKPLDLISGEAHLDNNSIDIEISSGGFDFNIPSEAILHVSQGTITTSGDYGIWLDGSLIIDGGIAQLDGGENYIQYTSSGNSNIELSEGGELYVGTQIRRSINTDEGILNFSQNNATVELGTQTSGFVSQRGVFEILGGHFSQGENDQIEILNSNGNASVPSLLYQPSSTELATGAGFTIDGADFGLLANTALQNLNVIGAAHILIQGLEVSENVSIQSGASLNAKDLDLTILGDFNDDGTYLAGSNTTYFYGSSDQTITGSAYTTFNNVDKGINDNTLNVDKDISLTGNLNIEVGTLNLEDNTITVAGNVNNNSSVTGSDVSLPIVNNGILLSGSEQQSLTGSGTYDYLTVSNENGVVVPSQSSAITVNKQLVVDAGILNIGRNLLVIGKSGAIVNGAGATDIASFSQDNMIQTNLSFTDAGIRKLFGDETGTSFTFPLGSYGKYTPVYFNITSIESKEGSIRVKAANEPHITVPDEDKDEVLQYYWTLDAKDIIDFVGYATMYSVHGDLKGTEEDYLTGKILLGESEWNKYSTDDFTKGTSHHESIFEFKTKPDEAPFADELIDGDYTAGAKLPNELQKFRTKTDGNWNLTSTWEVEKDGVWNDASTVPYGADVTINHTVNMAADSYHAAFKTLINENGVVNVSSTIGHRLGYVSGTGTIYLEKGGKLPAGDYVEFTDVIGGTIEYGGAEDYDVMGELDYFNNVIFSGSGDKRLPASNIIVGGALTINGVNLIADDQTLLNIGGDILFEQGQFTANQSTVAFVGDKRQNTNTVIPFTGSNSFYNLQVDNSAGIMLTGDVDVKNQLYLKSGIIYVDDAAKLCLPSIQSTILGGTDKSYVDGWMYKYIIASDNFEFPVGQSYRIGNITVSPDGASEGLWGARYQSPNDKMPTDDGSIDVDSDIEYVSSSENWAIAAPTVNNKAKLTLRWDEQSGVEKDKIKLLGLFDDTTWSLLEHENETGSDVSGTVQSKNFEEFTNSIAYFTFGAEEIPQFTWKGLTNDWFDIDNWEGAKLPHSGSDITIGEVGIAPVISNNGQVALGNNLEIVGDSTVTLLPGSKMTIYGDIDYSIDNALVIENSNEFPTSFIHYGQFINNNNVLVDWKYSSRRYWYVGHCVKGVTHATYANTLNQSGQDYFLYNYTTQWVDITSTSSDTKLHEDNDLLQGYSVIFKDEMTTHPVQYSGELINSNLERNVIKGDNLMANPYPSYVDFANKGDWDFDGFDKTIYVRTGEEDRGFATYNFDEGIGVNGGTSYVAPGQSFWINATVDNAIFKISTSSRIHQSAELKSTSSIDDDDIFRFTWQNEYGEDEAAIGFRVLGREVLTSRDSEKRMESGKDYPQAYTIKSSTRVSVDITSEYFTVKSIPIGCTANAKGIFTFKATSISSFLPNINVELEDMESGERYDLRVTSELEFDLVEGANDDRFVIHFSEKATDVESAYSGSKPLIYAANGVGYIRINQDQFNKNKGNCTVELYDLAGSKKLELDVLSHITQFDLPKTNNLWIVRLRVGKDSYSEKLSSFK